MNRAAATVLRLAAVTVIAAAIAMGLTVGTSKPVSVTHVDVTEITKADREPAAVHLVRTIPIPAIAIVAPELPPIPVTTAVAAVPVAVSGPAPAPPANICERHHGYRVVYRRGTYIGWRCEFPKGKP